jgi:hypothetical protein
MDIQIVRDFYKGLPDAVLLQKLKQESHGLTPEAIEVIREEIARRNLDVELIEVVAAQNKSHSMEDIDRFCDLLARQWCPQCNKGDTPLTTIYICQAVSIIYITFYTKKVAIGCPDCLRSECSYALGLTLFLGWWGVPHGPIRSIQTISNFVAARRLLTQAGPNDIMRGFVLANIGLLAYHKDNDEHLRQILHNVHKEKPVITGL